MVYIIWKGVIRKNKKITTTACLSLTAKQFDKTFQIQYHVETVIHRCITNYIQIIKSSGGNGPVKLRQPA